MIKTESFQNDKAVTDRRWYLYDAQGKTLGRFASEIAQKLMGKHKRHYSPHADCGDFVVVVNAEGIKITGNSKPVQKIDFRHSGYPGGLYETNFNKLQQEINIAGN